MPATAGIVIAAALLLAVAGLPKVFRPMPAVRALGSVGMRVPAPVVRIGGAVETAVGSSALIIGGRWPALAVAASYAGFTAFLTVALRRGGVVSSCGCIGREDTPPTLGHLLLTTTFAIGCAFAAATSALRPTAIHWDGAAVATIAFAVLAGWLGYLVVAVAPLARLPRESRVR